jgi:hypothetical protein
VLRRLKLDPQSLRRYDTNGDGRLDADEWQTARIDAEQLAAAEQLGEATVPAEAVVLGRPPRGLPFLLAETSSEQVLVSKYLWGGAALLLLGVTAAGTALVFALEFFRVK